MTSSDRSRTSRPVGEDDLTAYVDGQLSEERRAMVEEWLTRHPEHRARIEADVALAARLRRALGPVVEAPLPDRFRVEALRQERRRRQQTAARRLAAALALVALGGAGGWLLHGALGSGRTTFSPAALARPELNAALVAHRIYVPERLHPVEVSATARKHLETWLGKRLGARLVIPDLGAQGFALIGGRLLPAATGPAGLLMYQDGEGRRLTVYLAHGKGRESAFAFDSDGQVNMLGWRSPDLAYVVAGPFDRDRLVAVARGIELAQAAAGDAG